MATLTEKVGGSKATLYNYFKSKDDLVVAVFVHEAEMRREGILDLLDDAQADLRTQLITFGAAYLTFLSDPEFVASARSYISTTCSASSPAELADRMYENGPQKFWKEIGDRLAVRLETGDVQPRAQCCLTLHLKALLHAEFGEALLFGARPKVSPLDASVVAVDAFLMLYGSEEYRARATREHDARAQQWSLKSAPTNHQPAVTARAPRRRSRTPPPEPLSVD